MRRKDSKSELNLNQLENVYGGGSYQLELLRQKIRNHTAKEVHAVDDGCLSFAPVNMDAPNKCGNCQYKKDMPTIPGRYYCESCSDLEF